MSFQQQILVNDTFYPNKESAFIHVEDRGYQFGDGVYEVIRVYNGRVFKSFEHIQRLYRSANEISLSIPFSQNDMMSRLEELVNRSGLGTGNIYLQISRGAAPRTHAFPSAVESVFVAYCNVKERPEEMLSNGIKTITTEDIRWLRCDIKSLNLLGAVLANQQAHASDCYEAILHRDGIVTECSASNLFIVKEGTIFTHPANFFILNGITRQLILELAVKNGIKIIERPFTLEELFNAEEVFASSTTIEVMPVIQIDNTIIGKGKPGQLTKKLQELFSQAISSSLY